MKDKKFYSNRLFDISLAMESFEDDTNDILNELHKVIKSHNEYRNTKSNMTEEEQNKRTIELVNQYMEIANRIGKERFSEYDDGTIDYNYTIKNGENY